MSTYKWSVPTGKEINGQTYIKDTDNKISDTIDDLVDFVNGTGVHLNQGLAYDLVDRLSTQTISGIKTFSNGIVANVTGNITGNVTGNLTGNASGNAGTATKLQTSRNIELIGDVIGTASFDGSVNIQIDTTSTVIAIPAGAIVMWSGSIASIPGGWYLCDGTNGTPNLTNRFVIGAGDAYSVATTGGSKDAIVVAHTHTQASHTHNATTDSQGAHTHNLPTTTSEGTGLALANNNAGTSGPTTSSAGSHIHNITVASATPAINSTGSSGTNANLPPYYALAYIMKG